MTPTRSIQFWNILNVTYTLPSMTTIRGSSQPPQLPPEGYIIGEYRRAFRGSELDESATYTG